MIGIPCAAIEWRSPAATADSGAYQLVIDLQGSRAIRVGALGEFEFPAGVYIYTGRASRNLRTRLQRHLRAEKSFHWHIDYLLHWARVVDVTVFPGRPESECAINRETSIGQRDPFPVPGFGSSDCRCPAHLVWTGKE